MSVSRLESAFRTSVEGLSAHSGSMTVIGDNVANANTPAYKSQRAEFSDILGEKADDRLATVGTSGGDGVKVSRIRLNFDSGAPLSTGRDLDVAVSGRGFFLVGDVTRPQLTRLGNFQISQDGFLTTSDGVNVLGYTGTDPEILGPVSMTNLNLAPVATTQVNIFGNVDGPGGIYPPPQNPATFKDLARDAGFVYTQGVYDTTGARHDVQLYFFRSQPNQWVAQAYINGSDVGQGADQPVLLGQTNLTFDESGKIALADKPQSNIAITPAWGNGAQQNPITIDLSNFTQFAGGGRVINVTQNGRGNGDVVAYRVGEDGKISATTNTGDIVQVGTLALGLVNNPDGLERLGNGLYQVTQGSGALAIDKAKVGGRGTTLGGFLEASNVDLPAQFTDMIIIQRGYQANSQVLSAASDMMKNTIALIR